MFDLMFNDVWYIVFIIYIIFVKWIFFATVNERISKIIYPLVVVIQYVYFYLYLIFFAFNNILVYYGNFVNRI